MSQKNGEAKFMMKLVGKITNKFDIQIPNTKEALDAYEDGRRLYFTKKGQLNFSCADCHVYQTGTKLRADIPSPAIGHPLSLIHI